MQESIYKEVITKFSYGLILAPYRDASEFMNPELYGWESEDEILVPDIISSKPDGLQYLTRASAENVLARTCVHVEYLELDAVMIARTLLKTKF